MLIICANRKILVYRAHPTITEILPRPGFFPLNQTQFLFSDLIASFPFNYFED